MDDSIVCPNCGNVIVNLAVVSRTSFCPHCKVYLHSCVNCEFYAPGRANDCREPQAEYVRDKRGANFCDYFRLTKRVRTKNKEVEKRKRAIEEFKRLFSDDKQS